MGNEMECHIVFSYKILALDGGTIGSGVLERATMLKKGETRKNVYWKCFNEVMNHMGGNVRLHVVFFSVARNEIF